MENKNIKEKLHNHIKPLGVGNMYFLYYDISTLSETTATAFLNDLYNHFAMSIKEYNCKCKKSELMKPKKYQIGYVVSVEGSLADLSKVAFFVSNIINDDVMGRVNNV